MPDFPEEKVPVLLGSVEKLRTLSPRQLIKLFRGLRDLKSDIAADAKKRTEPLNELLKRVEGFLLAQMEEQEVNSFSTADGTAAQKTNRYVRVSDWGTFLEWAKENEHFDLLKRDVAKNDLLQFMDEFEEIPPGITVTSEVTVNVNKPRK